MVIPFNKPYMTGKELEYITQAHASRQLSGNGPFTKKCHGWLEEHIGCKKALLAHSCTAALEMAAILADIRPGDEVIMPSYTFVSTANAFVLRGGVPVFVDIRPDTLNLDETKIEDAVTPRTKIIVPVHYAGVGCEMDTIMAIAQKYDLLVIEDAAQGILSTYKSRPLGSIGHMAALSFHETKNIISGEGGALLLNDKRFIERSEIVWEKGTNRSQFFRGEVDKYSWVDIGSSYLPSEINAAFLYAQLEHSEKIIAQRCRIVREYHTLLKPLAQKGLIHLPVIDGLCSGNGHIVYILTRSLKERTQLIQYLREKQIFAIFHYIPLHSSPAGIKYGRKSGDLAVTEDISNRLLRLPVFFELTDRGVRKVVEAITDFYREIKTARG